MRVAAGAVLAAGVLGCVRFAWAWGEPGHSIIVDAALARLPADLRIP